MIAAFISISIVAFGGWGVATIISFSKINESQNERRGELNRALDFMAAEARGSTTINSDIDSPRPTEFNSSLNASGEEVDESSIQKVLSLQVPGLSKSVIYYIASPSAANKAWRGPKVVYRWGPPFKPDGNYSAGDDISTWTHAPLIDALEDTASTETCPTGWTPSPKGSATGFYACIDSSNKIAQLHSIGRVNKVLEATAPAAPYAASSQAFARTAISSALSLSGGSSLLAAGGSGVPSGSGGGVPSSSGGGVPSGSGSGVPSSGGSGGNVPSGNGNGVPSNGGSGGGVPSGGGSAAPTGGGNGAPSSSGGGSITLTAPATVNLEILGSAIQCGPDATSMKTQLVINKVKDGQTVSSTITVDPKALPSIPSYERQPAGTTFNFSGRVPPEAQNPNNTCNADTVGAGTVNSLDNSAQVKILRNGETVPDVKGFAGSASVKKILTKELSGTKITIEPNQYIILFELGVKDDTGSDAFDLQDLVVLATVNPI